MNLSASAKHLSKFITDSSPMLLTAVGVAGITTTAILSGKASYRAALILDQYEDELDPKEKVLAVWKLYIPAGVSLLTTCTVIILANRVGTRRTAAMAAALSLSERAFDEYKEKVVETIGKNKETKVRDDIAQDRVDKNPATKTEIHITGGGDVLCYDMYCGRYFRSDMETIKKAQNDTNYLILNNYYASLTDFYSFLGLSRTTMSDDVGWNSDRLLEIRFSTTMSDDQKPCLAMDFQVEPIRGYSRIN